MPNKKIVPVIESYYTPRMNTSQSSPTPDSLQIPSPPQNYKSTNNISNAQRYIPLYHKKNNVHCEENIHYTGLKRKLDFFYV